MSLLTITVEVSDDIDPTLVDPHDLADDLVDYWNDEVRAGNETRGTLSHVIAFWGQP